MPGLAEVTRQCEGNGLWFGYFSDSGDKGDCSKGFPELHTGVEHGASWRHDAPCLYMETCTWSGGGPHHQFRFWLQG